MALTDTKLRKYLSKPQENEIVISDRDGLSVRVSINGTITWQYRYRFNNKGARLKLGRYPDLSIEQARSKVPELRNWLAEGRNPASELKRKKVNTEGRPTLDECAEEWLTKYVNRTLKEQTRTLYQHTVKKYFQNQFPQPVEDITLKDWLRYFDGIADKSSPKMAGTALRRVKTMLSWCIRRGLVDGSPVMNLLIKDVGEKSSIGSRVLSLDEVAKTWLEIERAKASPANKICIQLLILTGARQSEIRLAQWQNFNFEAGVWTVPSEISKTNKPIRRPIPEKVKKLLEQLALIYGKEGFIIPGQKLGEAITTHSVNRFAKRIWQKLYDAHLTPEWTPHDFRRTLVTRLSEIEVMPHVTEKMLGHVLGGVMGVYNKHDWLKEQLAGYNLWAELIENEISQQLRTDC
ncbi:integrase arm-type DNA-binding domain-containing protein [Paraglaciecola sp.]|uniref:tyrosine-type recombinase/integrase n=1 Tax=Paraglaciecola sp. TaxID=1920173 RepID=UPI0030F48B47